MIKYKICTQSFIICIFSLNSIYVIRENKAVFLWNRLQNRIFFYCIPIYCGADNHQFTSRGVDSDVHTVKEKRWLARGRCFKESCEEKERERASERQSVERHFGNQKLFWLSWRRLLASAYIPVLIYQCYYNTARAMIRWFERIAVKYSVHE